MIKPERKARSEMAENHPRTAKGRNGRGVNAGTIHPLTIQQGIEHDTTPVGLKNAVSDNKAGHEKVSGAHIIGGADILRHRGLLH